MAALDNVGGHEYGHSYGHSNGHSINVNSQLTQALLQKKVAMTNKRDNPKKASAMHITMPASVSANTLKNFVEPLDNVSFFGRPSKSMVIRALCEIANERADNFKAENVEDYESLKAELRRVLTARKEG